MFVLFACRQPIVFGLIAEATMLSKHASPKLALEAHILMDIINVFYRTDHAL